MAHPLLLALFAAHDSAAAAARALHRLGVERDQLSVVARDHREQGALAREMGATPGAEIEDSRPAARLGELGGQILAAIAYVMPGIGPIVAAGPLSAELGEAAGHLAGGLAGVLGRAGVDPERASAWQTQIADGAILLGVHLRTEDPVRVERALRDGGATEIVTASWNR